MANIKQMVVQQNQAIMLTEANDYFKYLTAGLQKDKGVSITVDQSYMSSYDVNNELRNFVKNKTTAPADIQSLLDSNKTIADIVKENNYDKLKTYLDNLTSADFEPPLKQDFTSAEGVMVKQFPNHSSVDPRRTGRLVKPGPIDILKSTEVLKWMINNSVLYGYVLYSDNGLYYIGSDAIKKQLKNATDKQGELKKIVGRFLKTSNALGLLTTTAEKVLDTRLPDANSFADPGNLETIPTHQVKDNSGKIPELIVIDNQPVVKQTGLAYLAMRAEAAKAGVNLVIVSGFRPAFGSNFSGLTNKNRTISFTTQESIRRDKTRWTNRSGYSGTDEDFILKAPSSFYQPQTAAPGKSNHGTGIALDINTGTKDKNSLNNATYSWLVKNSYKFGFVRAVKTEEWHWEFNPDVAKQGPYAIVEGTDGNRFYTSLGLAKGQFQT